MTCRGETGRIAAGELMRWLRKTSLLILVWLTAAMTLVAGTPHFTCRCPSGRIKPFCLGSVFNKSGCCCNGECCCTKAGTACRCSKTSASDPQPVKTPCCCGQHDEPAASCCGQHDEPAPTDRTPTESSFSGSCCTKTLVQPKVSTFQFPQKPVLKDATLAVFLALQPPVFWAAPTEPCCFRLAHQRPPPTNLVIALQHFLI